MASSVVGTGIIQAEEIHEKSGELLRAEISYHGSFDVCYPASKRGDQGECFGRIPDTQLSTRNYDSRAALKHALQNGGAIVK